MSKNARYLVTVTSRDDGFPLSERIFPQWDEAIAWSIRQMENGHVSLKELDPLPRPRYWSSLGRSMLWMAVFVTGLLSLRLIGEGWWWPFVAGGCIALGLRGYIFSIIREERSLPKNSN